MTIAPYGSGEGTRAHMIRNTRIFLLRMLVMGLIFAAIVTLFLIIEGAVWLYETQI